MENELASIFYHDGSYEESVEDLKHRLLVTTHELELVKKGLGEEIKKNNEEKSNLVQILNITSQERDQARQEKAHLQKILNTLVHQNNQTEFLSENPIMIPGKAAANSGITDSSSLSETYNYHSHGSSPRDSFFDNVSSPDSGSIAFMQNNGMIPLDYQNNLDYASMEMERLASGRILPTRGNFLKAIREAGPLLNQLLLAGPLPQWRNPPQVQTCQIPPVSIKGCDAVNNNDVIDIKPTVRPYAEMSCASMLNFTGASPVSSCIGVDTRFVSPGLNAANNFMPLGKRSRLC